MKTVEINKNNFPDEKFREFVKQYDIDEDGYLSEGEIIAVTSINCANKEITLLKGIEHFTALTALDCSNNQLTALDVSNNAALIELNCTWNQLTDLDMSNNTMLKCLRCGSNQLTILDVSKNTALEQLNCNSNQLTIINISQNSALKILRCYYNQLTTLDVSQNTALTFLDCSDNLFTALDVSNNTALKYLYCTDNRLADLDISSNTALTNIKYDKGTKIIKNRKLTKRKKKWIIILSTALLTIIALVVSIVLIVNYQEQKKEHIQESYYRQNQAFTIVEHLFVPYVSGWEDKFPEYVQYHSYNEIKSESHLYTYLRLYEHETGNILTLEDVREYLSQEYNDDGTLRLSEQYPDMQAYIDFIWDFDQKRLSENGPTLLMHYDVSLMRGQNRLAEPYCDMKIYDLPLEQMQIVVDWSLNVSDEDRAQGYYFSWGKD